MQLFHPVSWPTKNELRVAWKRYLFYPVRNLFSRSKIYTWNDYLKRCKVRFRDWDGKTSLNGKTLVVKHTWGIGDTLFVTPVLKEIKERYPACRIVYVTRWGDLLLNNPHVDDIQDEGDAFNPDGAAVRLLRKPGTYLLNFDVELKGGIDFKTDLNSQQLLNEHIQKLLETSQTVSGWAGLNNQEKLAVRGIKLSQKIGQRYHWSVLDAYCKHGHVQPKKVSVYYYPTKEEVQFAQGFVRALKREKGDLPVLVLVPKTSTVYKDYPHWKEVLDALDGNAHVMIFGGFHDPKGEGLVGNSHQTIYDTVGSFTLRQSAAFMKVVDLLLCSDTGLLYVRGAFGLPALVLYGPHEPEPFLRYFPASKGIRIERLANGECSAGCWIDTVSCKKQGEYSPCMLELSPERVVSEIYALLGEGGKRSVSVAPSRATNLTAATVVG